MHCIDLEGISFQIILPYQVVLRDRKMKSYFLKIEHSEASSFVLTAEKLCGGTIRGARNIAFKYTGR